MPYYRNIGSCKVSYFGETINAGETKYLKARVMNSNLILVQPPKSVPVEGSVPQTTSIEPSKPKNSNKQRIQRQDRKHPDNTTASNNTKEETDDKEQTIEDLDNKGDQNLH